MMRYFLYILAVTTLAACGESGSYQKAEDAQDAGRQFIRASLDGDYSKAKFYLLKDNDNLLLINKWQENYQQLSEAEKHAFSEANITPVTINPVNDSTTLYTYTNTYHPKDTTTLRVIKTNNEWLVDLKSVIKM